MKGKRLPVGRRGKFIVIYGINNLGKTTQAKLLVKNLKKIGHQAEFVKYPVYDLEPAGKLINEYLRKGNPYDFTARELQLLHFIDRIIFENKLKAKLKKGINIIAEDYFGTGVAWGIGAGVSRRLLEYLFSFLLKEDLAFLFDGERFLSSIEKKHKNENDEPMIKKVRKAHLLLGKKYGWKKIDANLSVEKIQELIFKDVKRKLT